MVELHASLSQLSRLTKGDEANNQENHADANKSISVIPRKI